MSKMSTQSILPQSLLAIAYASKAVKRMPSSACALSNHSRCSGVRVGIDRRKHACECLCHKRNAVEMDPDL